MSVVVNQREHDEIAKSAAKVAGKNAKRAVVGFKGGLKLAGRGHTPLGQVRSGAVGRPTYSARGGSRVTRAGVHAGVVAGNAPTLAAGAAVGAAADRKLNKALHRRSESTVTASYGNRAEFNTHARGGGVRDAGSSTTIHIGNQRTMGGTGSAQRAVHRALVGGVKTRRTVSPKVMAGGAVLAAGGVALKRKKDSMAKSAFGVELGKALGDDNSTRGGVRADYKPTPKPGIPPKLTKIKSALAPAKSAMVAAAKVK